MRAACLAMGIALLALVCLGASPANLVSNADFARHGADAGHPGNYEISGDVEYRYLGDPAKDASEWGVALQSGKDLNRDGAISGSVSQMVTGIDAKGGRWFRFSFRGLPQDGFAVGSDDLYMKVEFFGDGGKTSFDEKAKSLYPAVTQMRRDLAINGDGRKGGAAIWRNYTLDFWLPFLEVDSVRLSTGFGHGAAKGAANSEFFITDFSLKRIEDQALAAPAATRPAATRPDGNLIPLGGRWFYLAKPGDTAPPALFDFTNADRLLYHDAAWSAPFDGNTTAWLRAGDKDLRGNIVMRDELITDNVTIAFDAAHITIHTHGLPNHPTAKFPADDFGPGGSNPNFIGEQQSTFTMPINPKVNSNHIVTTVNNSNHALPMGPIGVAINGVVFYNPFDANSEDASNFMDRCCGHPGPNSQYHYHKYPICVNSPWADEGADHSPLIGWAFDGFPIYGPYESAGVMAKDVKGENALNDFNLHFDKDRGWHYHVTPGKFPYIIGGYWGEAPARRRGPGGAPGGFPPGGRPPRNGPPRDGPPPAGD